MTSAAPANLSLRSEDATEPAPVDTVLLDASGIVVRYAVKSSGVTSSVTAVDGVDLRIRKGETVGLVGESGCGKSTLGRALIGLRPLHAGSVRIDSVELPLASSRQMRSWRRRLQIIFQDPMSSLNPRLRVGTSVSEPVRSFGLRKGRMIAERVEELMAEVGLPNDTAARFPKEFSGGQRQRIAIARALAAEPDFVVCDEPVSALDVSVQAHVLALLERLKMEFGLTYLFISHDLAVVRRISDRVAVMYLGRIVEFADRDTLYENPRHPYTAALLSAAPIADPAVERTRKRIVLTGDLPSPSAIPEGCPFHTRCFRYEQLGRPDRCTAERPVLAEVGGSEVACHFPLDSSEQRAAPVVADRSM